MSTHNVCFHEEIRKISELFGGKNVPYRELSKPMKAVKR